MHGWLEMEPVPATLSSMTDSVAMRWVTESSMSREYSPPFALSHCGILSLFLCDPTKDALTFLNPLPILSSSCDHVGNCSRC